MSRTRSRYATVSRRTLIKGSAVAGFAALLPGMGCSSNDDKSVFSTTSTSPAGSATTDTAASIAAPVTPESTATPAISAETTTATDAPAAGGFPGQLAIDFTYTVAESGRRIHNPYIAVWIEDADGNLLTTLSLWYQERERKYLNDLKRWMTGERARLDAGGADVVGAVSGPTRVAGTYSLVWNGTIDDGSIAPSGDYYVCIEAAREKGPYELIRESVTINGEAFSTTFPDNGELSNASATFTV